MKILQKLFGSNERQIGKLQPIVDRINALEASMKKLADAELKSKTKEFKDRISKGETLDDLLPEAFALTREAARRVIGERHFDVQLLGGIVLHQGKIAEMKTGEGKTLASTLPVYLNALTGKGVHVVTVNDYLAKRDCNWMGAIYDALGLTAACIVHDGAFRYVANVVDTEEVTVEVENLVPIGRKEAYEAEITYGTNNEFGFDYLRDNMARDLAQMVQRQQNFVIVDEVDSILIDEARTPLIISAPDSESTKLYQKFAQTVPRLKKDVDYIVDEKMRAVTLTDAGIVAIEKALGVGNLYEPGKLHYVHHLEQSLRAHALFERDKDYVVRDKQVVIVDEFTGRIMEGRRYSEGLHQAIEAKENVSVQRESRTLATITFQNYFRMYEKIAGMTGTAVTSAEELQKVYKLDVLEIPTNNPMIRKDLRDVIYKTEAGKFSAIVKKITELQEKGQPVLVGTIAIEKSEHLSHLLEKEGLRHEVLNAKNHEREALIIANAGKRGSVTIATNMAGRGTDIKLGDGVRECGGLCIIGTERHEARRIDNQLRGRSGRQGDPGTSQFFISLDDELMRRFGGDKLKGMMERFHLPDDQPIENNMISKVIENAQSKIEGFNFDIRKHVLDYDDVINKQREVIYKKRRSILEVSDLRNAVLELLREEIERIVSAHAVAEEYHWDLGAMVKDIQGLFPLDEQEKKKIEILSQDRAKEDREKISMIGEYFMDKAKKAYYRKEEENGSENMRRIEKAVLLQTIDTHWMNHLDEIDYLRQGIGLRGYGQRDPLIEYKKEAFGLFSQLMDTIRVTTIQTLFRATIIAQPQIAALQKQEKLQFRGVSDTVKQFGAARQMQTNGSEDKTDTIQEPIKKSATIGRNDPCYCGAKRVDGKPKKYKHCHGRT